MRYGNYKAINHLTPDLKNWSELYDTDSIYSKKLNHMNMQEQDSQQMMEERLWDYIDGLSSTAERSVIEQLIASNIEWQRKYRELLDLHQLVNSSEVEAPSMRFTKNVMEEIARYQVAPAARTYINKNVIRGVAAFFLTLITGFLIYILGQFKWSAVNSGPSSTLTPNLNNKIDEITSGGVFNSTYTTAFMLVAIICGWMLLDIYLQRKKQQHTNA